MARARRGIYPERAPSFSLYTPFRGEGALVKTTIGIPADRRYWLLARAALLLFRAPLRFVSCGYGELFDQAAEG